MQWEQRVGAGYVTKQRFQSRLVRAEILGTAKGLQGASLASQLKVEMSKFSQSAPIGTIDTSQPFGDLAIGSSVVAKLSTASGHPVGSE